MFVKRHTNPTISPPLFLQNQITKVLSLSKFTSSLFLLKYLKWKFLLRTRLAQCHSTVDSSAPSQKKKQPAIANPRQILSIRRGYVYKIVSLSFAHAAVTNRRWDWTSNWTMLINSEAKKRHSVRLFGSFGVLPFLAFPTLSQIEILYYFICGLQKG